jgi:hypothetical protein
MATGNLPYCSEYGHAECFNSLDWEPSRGMGGHFQDERSFLRYRTYSTQADHLAYTENKVADSGCDKWIVSIKLPAYSHVESLWRLMMMSCFLGHDEKQFNVPK